MRAAKASACGSLSFPISILRAHTHARGVRGPERSHTHSGIQEPERSYSCLGYLGAGAVFEGDLMTRCTGRGAFGQQRSLSVWAAPLAARRPWAARTHHPRVVSHQILQLADPPQATP